MFMEERQKDIVRKINKTGRILVSENEDYVRGVKQRGFDAFCVGGKWSVGFRCI